MNATALLAAFCLIGLAIGAGPASACSCMAAESASEQAETYELVFVGRVIDAGRVRDPRGWWTRFTDGVRGRPGPLLNEQITTFQVDEALKGQPGRNISLRHLDGDHGATCGISFPNDTREHVVLAYSLQNGQWGTSLCAMPQFPIDDYRDALRDPRG